MSEPSPPSLRFFPYDAPYDHQREAMGTIAGALSSGRDVLFEGATGTGKTLAALAPALEYARETDRTVVITTNVHQQTRQFIEEARAIHAAESLRAVVFRGKLDMCHLDAGYDECQAMREATRDAVEAESATRGLDPDRDAADLAALGAASEDVGETCEYYRENLVADTGPFYEWLFDGVRTPEEVFAFAGERGYCGYELLKEGVEGVDLAIANYHHLLDPSIREHFFRWLGRDPEEVVAVFDEAHNVAEAARDHARRTLAQPTLEAAVEECTDCVDPRAERAVNVVRAFRDALVATYDDALAFGEREAVGDDWYDLAIASDDTRDDLTLAFLEAYTGAGIHGDVEAALELGGELDGRYGEAYKRGETDTRKQCRLLQAAGFLESWLDDGGRHRVASVRRDRGTDEVYGRAELYTCIPRRVTAPLFEELHASVLMSATLRPFDVLRDTLGVDDDPVEMAYGAQFPGERRRTYAVDVPALFASRREDPDLQERVAGVLVDAVRFTPGNTLAFFPSYGEAERYHDLFEGRVDAETYLDEPATRAQELKESFVDDDGGILLTSLWGTLGEGVSFDGDDARTVVVVGVPYPHLDDRVEAVRAAYEAAFGDAGGSLGARGNRNRNRNGDGVGWRYAVEIPTVRKTRQALGRVIRSPEDFGVRVLVDERYTDRATHELPRYGVVDAFPPEERDEIIDVEPRKLKFAMLNFYSDLEAWTGTPPEP